MSNKQGTYIRKLKEVPCKKCGALHLAKRADAVCAACRQAYKQQWIRENKEYFQSYKRDPAKEKTRNKLKRQKYADKCRAYYKAYHASRPGLKNAWDAKRRAKELQATPPWADKNQNRAFYETAQGLSMLLGEWFHVDHIVPLQSKLVCGLHCEANLQILSAVENLSKSNRRWPHMPDSEGQNVVNEARLDSGLFYFQENK